MFAFYSFQGPMDVSDVSAEMMDPTENRMQERMFPVEAMAHALQKLGKISNF